MLFFKERDGEGLDPGPSYSTIILMFKGEGLDLGPSLLSFYLRSGMERGWTLGRVTRRLSC